MSLFLHYLREKPRSISKVSGWLFVNTLLRGGMVLRLRRAGRKGFRRTDVIRLQPLARKAEINIAINDSQQVILRDLFFRRKLVGERFVFAFIVHN